MENIIYYLCNNLTFSTDLNIKGVKIGSTKNIISRMKVYQTGYVDLVPLVCYYKIDKNCYEVDYNIQKYYNNIRLNNLGSKGGTEFYDLNILTPFELENFFNKNNINFTKYYLDDYLIKEIQDFLMKMILKF